MKSPCLARPKFIRYALDMVWRVLLSLSLLGFVSCQNEPCNTYADVFCSKFSLCVSFLETAELEECKSDAKNIMDQAAAAEQLSNNALVQRCDAYANTTSSMTCEEFNNLYAADSNSDSNSSGSGNSGTGYTSDDISKCCNCLVDAVWSEWSDGSNKKYCFESEASQCISALEHGSSITMLSPRCTGQYCAGDCWFLR